MKVLCPKKLTEHDSELLNKVAKRMKEKCDYDGSYGYTCIDEVMTGIREELKAGIDKVR